MSKTCFLWDPIEDNIVRELNDGGATVAEYTTEPDHFGNVISQNRSGIESHFHFDALGSTVAVTKDDQHVTDTRGYTSFGVTTEATGATVVRFDYIGQKEYYHDPTDDGFHVRHRILSPVHGRWTSCDPDDTRHHHASMYLYVHNRRLSSIDPSGLKACKPPPGQAKAWCDEWDKLRSCWFVTADVIKAMNWCLCLKWHDAESTRGGGWLVLLPACPCNIGKPAANPDPTVWENPKRPNVFERPGHPDAATCMRSKPIARGNHGQQCCYDESGALITGGPSAGSPDYKSPVYSISEHVSEDVNPFNACKEVDCVDVYFEHRPPDNSLKCKKNEK
jgi:RHS repeat-associated protein